MDTESSKRIKELQSEMKALMDLEMIKMKARHDELMFNFLFKQLPLLITLLACALILSKCSVPL